MAKKAEVVTLKTVRSDAVAEVKELLAFVKEKKYTAEEEHEVLNAVYKVLDARMTAVESKLPAPEKAGKKKAVKKSKKK